MFAKVRPSFELVRRKIVLNKRNRKHGLYGVKVSLPIGSGRALLQRLSRSWAAVARLTVIHITNF
jgi:hypothetical protein